MRTCIHQTTLITCQGTQPAVLAEHSLVFENGVITRVGPAADLQPELARPTDLRVIDGRSHLVIPGLINTHHHLFQSLTRGLKSAQDAKLFDWLTELYARWRRLQSAALRTAAQVSIAELLLSGCTTTSDHFYLYPRDGDGRIEDVIEAADSLGIRIHACRGSMSVGRSRGGLPPDECTQNEQEILQDCVRAVERWHDPEPLARRRIDIAPCSPFTVSTELFRDSAVLARERGVLLHTHAAETLEEERYCLERFGVRPIPYLRDCGWLGSDVYLAHCVHLDDEDISAIASTGTGVAHCPCSNMRLGSGIPPIRRLIQQGAKVGLGVDGSSSNDGGHLLAEARQALLLQRVAGGADALAVADAFRLATIGGAAVLNRPRLGRIEVGAAADLAMYRSDDIALAGAVAQDPLGALILCHVGRADRVIVHGETVVENGHLVRLDEQRLAADLNQFVRAGFR
jgi:8-oxoguanine deaminase